jgi:hypothetical protein
MFKLTSRGLLARAHHMIETNVAARSGAVTATAAAVGLAAGRSKEFRKLGPSGLMAGGAALTYFGLTGMGDGLLAAGAVVFGYRRGATGSYVRRPSAPSATVRNPTVRNQPPAGRRRG